MDNEPKVGFATDGHGVRPRLGRCFNLGRVAFSTTDALGRTTTYQYDVMGRQVAEIAPAPGGGNNTQAVTSRLYDADGNLVQSIDVLGNSTEYHYSALGHQDLLTQPGTAQGLPQTQVVYDADGNQSALIDPDGNVTTWSYNAQGQVTGSSQGQVLAAGATTTTFANLTVTSKPRTFEVYVLLSGSLGSTWQASDNGTLTITSPSAPADPLGSGWQDLGSVAIVANDASTSITLTYSGVSPQEIALVGYSDSDYYNAAGELAKRIDRDGRAIVYTYNALGQETAENWYPTSDTSGSPTETLTWVYDEDGHVLSASDSKGASTATDSYTYDAAGDVLTETQQIPGLTPAVTLASQYTNGNRTQLAVAIGGTDDFVNTYQYAGLLGQMSQVSQIAQTASGSDAVAPKTATFKYDLAGEFADVRRYAYQDSTHNLVAKAIYGYDGDGNLTLLGYTDGGGYTIVGYAWSYDAAGNMATSYNTFDGTVTYTSDGDGQLTGATSTSTPSLNEAYGYDLNGNRLTANNSNGAASYSTGPNNELLCDGTYNYTYDAEGNRTSRTRISSDTCDDHEINYSWDDRNRLTSVTFKNNNSGVTRRSRTPTTP